MLSRSSEYAIRALTFLAQHQSDSRHYLARDMAEQLGIPAPFLGKVLQPLVTRGILHSRRGRSGGFRLARPAGEIRLVDIVETQETVAVTGACLLGQVPCNDAEACPLHDTWKRAYDSFHARLRTTSLADMVDSCAARPESGYPYPSPGSRAGPHRDAPTSASPPDGRMLRA